MCQFCSVLCRYFIAEKGNQNVKSRKLDLHSLIPTVNFGLYKTKQRITILESKSKVVQASGQSLIGPLTAIEFRIMLQSLLLFIFVFVLILGWFFSGDIPAMLEIGTYFYLVYCCLNPVLYLTLNWFVH